MDQIIFDDSSIIKMMLFYRTLDSWSFVDFGEPLKSIIKVITIVFQFHQVFRNIWLQLLLEMYSISCNVKNFLSKIQVTFKKIFNFINNVIPIHIITQNEKREGV